MKNALRLVILFFSLCIIGTLVCSVFLLLHADLAMLVAGNSLAFFSADFFLRALFVALPFVTVLSFILLILYTIRHPLRPVLVTLTCAVLCLLSWGVIIPLNTLLARAYEQNPFSPPDVAELTPGYFREYNGNVYYYSRTFHLAKNARDMYGEGLMIDLSGIRGKVGSIYPFSTSITVHPQNNFTDVIFMNAAKMPAVVATPVFAFRTLHDASRAALAGGMIPWISFAFLGVALFSVLFLRRISRWRFINMLLVCFASIIVLMVNALVCAHRILSDVSLVCEDLFFDASFYLPDVFSGVGRIREPLALFINIGFVLLFVVLGSLGRFVSRRNRVAVYAEDEAL